MDPLHLSEWEKRLRSVEAKIAHVTKRDANLDAWQASLARAHTGRASHGYPPNLHDVRLQHVGRQNEPTYARARANDRDEASADRHHAALTRDVRPMSARPHVAGTHAHLVSTHHHAREPSRHGGADAAHYSLPPDASPVERCSPRLPTPPPASAAATAAARVSDSFAWQMSVSAGACAAAHPLEAPSRPQRLERKRIATVERPVDISRSLRAHDPSDDVEPQACRERNRVDVAAPARAAAPVDPVSTPSHRSRLVDVASGYPPRAGVPQGRARKIELAESLGGARGKRTHMTMVTNAEFREIVSARAELRPCNFAAEFGAYGRQIGGAPSAATVRAHSLLLDDAELAELTRARRIAVDHGGWPELRKPAAMDAPRRPQSARRHRDNFNELAHLVHRRTNAATFAWEANLREELRRLV